MRPLENTIEKSSSTPCVYILKCSDGTLYTGWTNDIMKRIRVHNSGRGAKYTRSRTPVTPVYLEYMPDKSSAVRREAAIKKLTRQKKLMLIASSSNQFSQPVDPSSLSSMSDDIKKTPLQE